MADLLNDPPEAPARLLEPSLIVKGGLTVLAAPTKVGKTNLWFHIAWALTDGRPLFGRFAVAQPTSVLMLQLELSPATVYERLAFLRDELDWSLAGQDRFLIRCERAMLLDRRGGADRIVRIIEAASIRPEVVILDSYNAAVAGDPDKSAESRRALHALREVQERTGVTWAVTAEMRKAPAGTRIRYALDDLKGSNELAYDADAVVGLRPLDESRRRLAVHFLAMRHLTADAPERLVLIRRGLTFDLTEGGGADDGEAIAEVIRAHLRQGGDENWRACRQVVSEAGLSVRNDALSAIRRLVLAEVG
jgi:hypothetical protein